MRLAKRLMMAATVLLSAPPVSAQVAGFSPPYTYFNATGKMTLNKVSGNSQNIWPCAIAFNATVGTITGVNPATSNSLYISAWTASASACTPLTANPARIYITSMNGDGGIGYIDNLTWNVNGSPFCSMGQVPIKIINKGAGQSAIQVESYNVNGCNLLLEVATCPDINAVLSAQRYVGPPRPCTRPECLIAGRTQED